MDRKASALPEIPCVWRRMYRTTTNRPQKRELVSYGAKFPPCGPWRLLVVATLAAFDEPYATTLLCPLLQGKKSPIYRNKKPCSSCTFSFFILLPLTHPPYCIRATKLFLMKFSFFVLIFLVTTIFFCLCSLLTCFLFPCWN